MYHVSYIFFHFPTLISHGLSRENTLYGKSLTKDRYYFHWVLSFCIPVRVDLVQRFTVSNIIIKDCHQQPRAGSSQLKIPVYKTRKIMNTLFTVFILAAGASQVAPAPLYMDHQVQEDYVPILGYHNIGDFTSSLTIELAHYEDQIDYLTNVMNCNWMTMIDLGVYVANGEKLPTNTCIINFDDGSADQYNLGLCALNEHGVPATYYIAPSNLGTSGYYMTEDNVQSLFDLGHDIAAHTLTHARLSDLSIPDQETEILGSKVALENMGYPVTTFAYPFGAYNDDTLDILRASDYVLTRDTSQDSSWKDVRAPLVSFNPDNYLHYYYIKPEGLSGSQLADVIKYIGWWQFEGEYLAINDADGDVRIRSSEIYRATDTSYAVLSMYDVGDEISTQFITKYSGGFTLDMFLYTTSATVGFDVSIDGVTYTPEAFQPTDSGYLQATSSGGFEFRNYYVNIPSLSPGIHVFNVIITEDVTMHLDKFRLFSDTNQDFSDPSSYNQCNPATDEFCACGTSGPSPTPPPTPATSADPTCSEGIIKDNICCNPGCSVCGGATCGADPLTGQNCCGGPIEASGRSCEEVGAPCVMIPATPAPVTPTDPDPMCELGIITDNTCCSSECITCGGSGCSLRPGGASSCCGGPIASSGRVCDEIGAPCLMTSPETTPAPMAPSDPDPTCSTGLLTDNICCNPDCGICGGTSCGADPLGGTQCCGGVISSNGRSCSEYGPPCTVDSEPAAPSDPNCDFGILNSDICCLASCGSCAGVNCGSLPGGSSGCCATQIRNSGLSCDDNISPCVFSV